MDEAVPVVVITLTVILFATLVVPIGVMAWLQRRNPEAQRRLVRRGLLVVLVYVLGTALFAILRLQTLGG